MNLSRRELSILGASLYVCEGAKFRVDNRGWNHYVVEFTNSDPRTVILFLKFLRECLPVVEERIKAQLFVYPDLNEDELIQTWSGYTQIPKSRFNKSIHLIQRSGRFKPSRYGTMKIRYHHKEHFLKIQDIISKVFGGVA